MNNPVFNQPTNRRLQHAPLNRQRGLASVEFAIVGLVTLTILFMAIEMGRMLFTLNTLAEVTRRGARVAAVCTVDNLAISRIAIFNDAATAGPSPILGKLTTNNIRVEYLAKDGGVLTDYAGAGNEDTYTQIEYVRVRVVGYQHRLIIPGLSLSITAPEYPTTIPRESLGVPRPDQTSTCA
jgi:Flp pilus assembly protein TadG